MRQSTLYNTKPSVWELAARRRRVVLNANRRTPQRSRRARSNAGFLSALVRGGANLEAVRELAGHSKLLTMQRYLHASGAELRDAVSRLAGNAKPLGN